MSTKDFVGVMPKENRRKTGKHCVAAGCTSRYKDDVSLHEFPNKNSRNTEAVDAVCEGQKEGLRPAISVFGPL